MAAMESIACICCGRSIPFVPHVAKGQPEFGELCFFCMQPGSLVALIRGFVVVGKES